MKLLSPAISRFVRMRFWRIENWSRHPVAVQREVLQELVTAAQHTALGKKYKFRRKAFGINFFFKSHDE